MIQRKQTVFLIIALLFTVACLCMPVGELSYNKMGGDAVIYNLWVAAETGKMFTVWPLDMGCGDGRLFAISCHRRHFPRINSCCFPHCGIDIVYDGKAWSGC